MTLALSPVILLYWYSRTDETNKVKQRKTPQNDYKKQSNATRIYQVKYCILNIEALEKYIKKRAKVL